MVKMNMRKIEDTIKQLKDENDSIERRYRPVICCTCLTPATHLPVKGHYPNYVEKHICYVCSTLIQKLSDYEWDEQGIVNVYELM